MFLYVVLKKLIYNHFRFIEIFQGKYRGSCISFAHSPVRIRHMGFIILFLFTYVCISFSEPFESQLQRLRPFTLKYWMFLTNEDILFQKHSSVQNVGHPISAQCLRDPRPNLSRCRGIVLHGDALFRGRRRVQSRSALCGLCGRGPWSHHSRAASTLRDALLFEERGPVTLQDVPLSGSVRFCLAIGCRLCVSAGIKQTRGRVPAVVPAWLGAGDVALDHALPGTPAGKAPASPLREETVRP